MKVKMLEELVEPIDGEPASGCLFPGRGSRGGRLTQLSWDPHPCCTFSRGHSGVAGAGATLAFYEGDIIRVQRVPSQEVMSGPRSRQPSLLLRPAVVTIRRQPGLFGGRLCPVFLPLHAFAIKDAA